MSTYQFPGGREVYLVQLCISGTYAGQMEGDSESLSPSIWERTPERIAEMMPPGKPLAVVPAERPLPAFICVAELLSRKAVHTNDSDYGSKLFVCWFAARTDHSVDHMIESAIAHVQWERVAQDYNVMDF